ncbi:hypothetical protein K438DRAFT_1919276 [Mycena galopus ATCC 62051]|nr:hypothetical protein K438DRAFT_1919276 [Mycena galopus ATCC 62051]
MESLAAKERIEQERTAELKRQIAALRAQLPDSEPESPSRVGPPSPKRRKLDTGTVLAPTTPSPSKIILDPKKQKTRRPQSSHPPLKSFNASSASASSASLKKQPEQFFPAKPVASTLLSKLANVNRRPDDTAEAAPLVRTSAFTDAPLDSSISVSTVPQRDDRLAIIENLDAGPVDHKPSFDDPHFEQLEPNSGIRLSSRIVPHEDLQDHLRGRYYLSPSRLYSVARLLPDKQGYDVPVAGDWITIAVVAERGPFKYTKAPVEITPDDEDDATKGRKGKAKDLPKPSGRKFINLRLVDFGAPARSASSATGGKAIIRGDAMLSLLLFESDGFEMVPQDEGRPKKVYRGGSRGAFEEMCDLKEGDVVALLNPRIFKPFERKNDSPHPTTNILAITPDSSSSILIIGRAKDLGLCVAVKRDGKACRSWCDTRVSDVCEWHVQRAVEQRRANRPEFAAGTSGMSTTAHKRKADYDPRRKWGLKPLAQESSGATYVVAGHIVSGGRGDPRDSLFISERMGREGQAKASRKLAASEDARVLKALQGRDAEGMKPVMKAREAGLAEKEELRAAKNGKGKQKAGTAKEPAADAVPMPVKSAFSAQQLKDLGFDPTIKPGQRRHDDAATKKKIDALALLQASRKPIKLGGPRTGEKVRSSVVVPSKTQPEKQKPFDSTPLHDLDDDMPPPAQLLKDKLPVPDPDIEMVDLDDA